jgi:4-amino-4-deoxy-L-arabinose transferase-like glycosyltransferase
LRRWFATPRAIPWILFLAALVPRLLFVALAHPPGDYVTSDMWVYDLRATHLLRGDLGPWDSFTPAGYPAFLAGLYSIAGRQLMLVGVVQALLSASTVVLTYALAMEVGCRRATASLAAVVIALHVPMVLYSGLLLSETLFSFVLILGSYLLLRSISKPSFGLAAVAGLTLGCAAVVRPNLLVVLPFVPIVAFFGFSRTKKRTAVHSLVVLAVAIVPLSAHSWHNSRLVDRWVPTSTNGGLNFYLNVAEVRSVEFKEGSYTHRITPIPNLIRYDHDERVERPFYDDRYFYAAGFRRIVEAPRSLLKGFWSLKETLGLGRQDYWPGWPPWRVLLGVESHVFSVLVVLPGLLGLGLVFKRRMPVRPDGAGWVWIAALILGNLLAAAVYLGDPRLRVPYDPFYAIAAAVVYVEAGRRIHARRRSRSGIDGGSLPGKRNATRRVHVDRIG